MMDDNYKALLLVLAAWDRAESSKITDTDYLKGQADYWIIEAQKHVKTDDWCTGCRQYGYHEDYCDGPAEDW